MKTQFRTVYAVVHTPQCAVMSMQVCAHYIPFRGGIDARVKPSQYISSRTNPPPIGVGVTETRKTIP